MPRRPTASKLDKRVRPMRGVRMRRIVPTMLLGFFVMDLSLLILAFVIHLPMSLFAPRGREYRSTLVNCVARVVSEARQPVQYFFPMAVIGISYTSSKTASPAGERKVMATG